jgi:hypothetical protein
MGAFDKEDRWDEHIISIQVGINVSNGMLYDEESEVVDVKEERNIIMTGLEQYQGGAETAFRC